MSKALREVPADCEIGFGFRGEVVDVDGFSVDHASPGYPVAADDYSFLESVQYRKSPIGRHHFKQIALNAKDMRVLRATHTRSVFGHGIKDRLDVGRRAGDYAQDLGGRCLLLERFAQLLIARFNLLI